MPGWLVKTEMLWAAALSGLDGSPAGQAAESVGAGGRVHEDGGGHRNRTAQRLLLGALVSSRELALPVCAAQVLE